MPKYRAVALVLLPILLVACRGGAVTSFRLEHDAASLQSVAQDGAMTANSAAKGEATTPFTRTHARELARQADELATILASAQPKRALAQATSRLIRLARVAAAKLERLAEHPADARLARRVGAELAQVAQQTGSLGPSG